MNDANRAFKRELWMPQENEMWARRQILDFGPQRLRVRHAQRGRHQTHKKKRKNFPKFPKSQKKLHTKLDAKDDCHTSQRE